MIFCKRMIQICSGITSGRVLNGELYAQRLPDVNLSTFAYRLFHEDFSSILRANLCGYFVNCDYLVLCK